MGLSPAAGPLSVMTSSPPATRKDRRYPASARQSALRGGSAAGRSAQSRWAQSRWADASVGCQSRRESAGGDRPPAVDGDPDQRLALPLHGLPVLVPIGVLTGDAA